MVLSLRWIKSGHFPLSNLYESLMFLSWSLTFLNLFIELVTLNLNDLIYFLGIDIILFLWALIAFKSFNNIISWTLLMLGIGKIFDEFLAPYGYHLAEQLYDILIFTWAICKFINRKRKLKQHRYG